MSQKILKDYKPRPYQEGERLEGRLMRYHCRYTFLIPANATSRWTRVKCKNPKCGKVNDREHFQAAKNDPLRHPLGWPYDNPTIPYDC